MQPGLDGAGELTDPRAAVLVMHGGKADSLAEVEARQLAVARMVPIARRLVRAGADGGLAVWRLRFRYRGWNSDAHPVEDARWALSELAARHGEIPVVLVGHSMGGRTAVRVADEPTVAGVVALAPWLPPGEPVAQLADTRLLVVHGGADRVTSPAASRAVVARARPLTATAGYVGLRHCGHAMVRRLPRWHALTTDFVLHAALGQPLTGVLAETLADGGRDVLL